MATYITDEQIEKNKEEYISLLRSSGKDNIETLITWLTSKSDFFTAPSSSSYHSNYKGGLCEHSLNVYKVAKKLQEHILPMATKFADPVGSFTDSELLISCLLHDLCKVNFYAETEKLWKDEEAPYGQQWKKYIAYKIDDKFPLGHGEKSMFIAQNFIKLTGNECLAIRWHMHFFSPASDLDMNIHYAFQSAVEQFPIVSVVAQADTIASFMIEPCIDQRTGTLK